MAAAAALDAAEADAKAELLAECAGVARPEVAFGAGEGAEMPSW